jgi:hypothetical protein
LPVNRPQGVFFLPLHRSCLQTDCCLQLCLRFSALILGADFGWRSASSAAINISRWAHREECSEHRGRAALPAPREAPNQRGASAPVVAFRTHIESPSGPVAQRKNRFCDFDFPHAARARQSIHEAKIKLKTKGLILPDVQISKTCRFGLTCAKLHVNPV